MSKTIKAVLLLFILLAIPAGVYLVSKAGSAGYRTRAGGHEEVFVFIMPSQVSVERGEKIDFAVKIDTGQETIGGVDLLIDFDSSLLSPVGTVQAGSAFPELTSKTGLDQISLRGQGNLVGQGTIATLSFEGIVEGEGAIEIDEVSVVWDEEVTTNILGKTTGARVMVE